MTKKVRVKKSPGKGRGVFASKTIKTGETIENAPVLLVPLNEFDLILSSFLEHYVYDVQIGADQYLGIALGYGSLYNHNNNPNADWVINANRILIKAVRPISEGQEIYIHYGWDARMMAIMGIE